MSSRVLRKRKRGTSPPEGSNNGVHKQARLEEQQSAEQVMDLDEKQTQGDTDDADMFAKWTTLADSSSRQNSSPDRQQEEPRAASESLSMPIEDLELLKDLTYGADPSPSSLQPDSDMAGEALVLMDETPTVELPTAEVLAAIAQSDSVIINNNNNNNVNEEDDLQMTGYGPAPSYAVDLTAVPSSPPPPPFPPLSPLAPGRFRYFRPLRPGPTKREPTFQIDEQNPHDWTFDYDFSDDEDVPKPLFDPDARDYFDNRRPDGEVYGQMLEFGDHDKRQAELEQRIDWLENNVMLVTELLRAGLYMNRILRIYHNGCLRGGAPLGEELGRAQGAASQRPPPNPTGFVPSKGDRRFKEPLTRQGLNALYRHVDRVREALDGIPAIFKDCFDSNLELDFRGARVQQTLHEWIREIMLRHRGNAFWSGFEVLSALDLQTIDRVCRFADTRWQTPVNIGKEPVVDEDVWEV